MCVDYTDLNKHCPKDPFAFPHIDQVTDSTTGCVLVSLLNCYLGYHQIALKEEDHIKTAFITPFGAYAYTTMSFGGPSNYALLITYIAMLNPMWMTWSSRPDPMTSSSLISRKPSTTYASLDGRLIQPSASSACHKENYLVSSLVIEEMKQTRRRSLPS
jgi:hypothetical protein